MAGSLTHPSHCKAEFWRSGVFLNLGSVVGQTVKAEKKVAVRLEKASKVHQV